MLLALKFVVFTAAFLCITQTVNMARLVRRAEEAGPAEENVKQNIEKANEFVNEFYSKLMSSIDQKALGDAVSTFQNTITDASKKLQQHITEVTAKMNKQKQGASEE